MLGLDLMPLYVFFSLHDVYALLTRDNYAKYIRIRIALPGN